MLARVAAVGALEGGEARGESGSKSDEGIAYSGFGLGEWRRRSRVDFEETLASAWSPISWAGILSKARYLLTSVEEDALALSLHSSKHYLTSAYRHDHGRGE